MYKLTRSNIADTGILSYQFYLILLY